jgi:hypothetical protein
MPSLGSVPTPSLTLGGINSFPRVLWGSRISSIFPLDSSQFPSPFLVRQMPQLKAELGSLCSDFRDQDEEGRSAVTAQGDGPEDSHRNVEPQTKLDGLQNFFTQSR